MAIDFTLIGMEIQRRIRGGMKVLCLSIVLAVACLGCKKAMPELDPNKFISTASGKAYEVAKEGKPDSLPAEKLPGISDNLQTSGNKLSLADLVDTALRINPSTRKFWELARAAAADWAVSRGDYYPSISGDASGMGMGGDSSSGYYGNVGLSLSYLLLDFGGRAASVESARQALIAANWNHNQTIQDVLRDVPQAYYTYLGNKAQLRASESSLKEALTSLQSTEQRRKAGVSTIADVLQARSNADQVRLDLVTNRGAVRVSRGQLATAVGWPANTDFDVEEAADTLPLTAMTRNMKTLIGLALRDRPDVASARAAVRQSEADLRKADSDLWPKLTATGNAGWSGIDGSISDADSLSSSSNISSSGVSYYGGLSIQFPLFEGFSLRNKVRSAKANLKANRAALRLKEESVISDVWSAFYNVRTAAQQVESTETLLHSAKESYKVSLARYRAGVANIVELLNAQSTLASARTQRVQARTDLLSFYAELLHAIGAELPADLSNEMSMQKDKREVSSANGR